MDSIVLMIPGDPQGQPRPRARAMRAGGGWTASVYQPERERGADGIVRDLPITTWRRRVAAQVRLALPPEPWRCPCKLDVVFYFERTQELMRPKHSAGLIPHTVKPDVDNAVKAIMDELVEKRTKRVVVRRGILRDDSCVCELHVRKWWCERGAEAGAVVTVSRIGAAAPALPFVEPAPMGGAMPAPQTDPTDLLVELRELLDEPSSKSTLTLYNQVQRWIHAKGLTPEKYDGIRMLRGAGNG